MNLHQLTVFSAVVETAIFSRAAVEVRLAQSAVGCPIRTPRRSDLTLVAMPGVALWVGKKKPRPLAATIIGAPILSQLLTLHPTPLIYQWFDRLALYFKSLPIENKRRRRPDLIPAD